MKYVKWFKELSREDIPIAGGKGANLGELTQAGIPVPPGFVVLSSAYYEFIEYNHLKSKIYDLLSKLDAEDNDRLNKAAALVQKLIAKAKFPPQMSAEIFAAYAKLGSARVAVRSSATAEDLPDASFAGQQESFLNIEGDTNVLLKVRECYESLFGSRAIYYRVQKKYDHFKVGIAVPVQAMIQSEVSGVMFTVDPISQDKDKLVIEGAYGLGDYVVQGVVTPDHFEVSKTHLKIIDKQVSKQLIMEVRSQTGVKKVAVPKSKQSLQKISDAKVVELAQIGKKIQSHYMAPQDIEWAMEKNTLYITQARPITTLSAHETASTTATVSSTTNMKLLVKGAPASPGLVSGPVKQVLDIKYLDKVLPGDILVTPMTTPDFVPAMKKAAGIVTDRGGLTSHAAIVSRELGVPCIVGTTTATKELKDGMIVTLDGGTGEVFAGAVARGSKSVTPAAPSAPAVNIKTATKLYVNLAEPELADKMSEKHVDGVGLLRAEFMLAGIGVHPKKVIAEGKQKEYIEKLANQMAMFCKNFFPRPVIYRATDFKTNEYRSLKGGDQYEPEESNPMLGFRGAYRYVKSPEVFNLELEAIKIVRNKMKLTNLWLMIPFVSTVNELVEVKKLVTAANLHRTNSFKLFMMVEIPANVILLDDFLDVGIDGVSIGSNDLTMLILGIDRDNSEVAPNFDERNPAVMWALEKTVRTCARRNIMCGICGQAPSEYPELVEKLVQWGIYSISVNPDRIDASRQLIANAEHHFITHKKS